MADQEPQKPKRPFRPPDYRGRRRAAQHELAEAGADQSHPEILPDDPLVPRDPPELVADEQSFLALVEELRDAGRFAYDSEFIGEQSYYPRLCLIQVATTQRVALIDPIPGFDLKPFWRLLADDGVKKIVHAGGQDLEPVVRHLDGTRPRNVFDTQIAAGFAGMRYPISLTGIVSEFLGVELGKGSKFSQWDRRPLSVNQHRYAANDVRFLLAIHERLRHRLAEYKNHEAAAAEFDAQCEPSLYLFDPNQQAMRVRGTRYLDAREMEILTTLVDWRNGAAREADVPPRTYLSDGVMMEMSRNPPTKLEELAEYRHFPRPIQREQGPMLMELIHSARKRKRGENADEVHLPEETAEEKQAIGALWERVQQACRDQGIDPTLFGSRRELSSVVRKLARGCAVESKMLRGWRETVAGALVRGGVL